MHQNPPKMVKIRGGGTVKLKVPTILNYFNPAARRIPGESVTEEAQKRENGEKV